MAALLEQADMSESIRPFRVETPQAALDDLRARVVNARWPEKETVDDWSQGAPIEHVRALADYWSSKYDWRRCEAALNALPQFKTTIDGLEIYFIHLRSAEPNAAPLLLTHGWPGSVLEFMKVIGPLTAPSAHGAKGARAFDVVVPALPGYGFSGKPAAKGWGVERTAQAWITLMRRLGRGRDDGARDRRAA
jgi:epoxide hydrolase